MNGYFAETSSGIGALGVDGKALIIQLITFVIAFWVLQRFAFKPILKVMNKRRQTIEAGVRLGEDMRREKAALEKRLEEQLHISRQKADAIVAEAENAARDRIRAAEDTASAKAAVIIAEGKQKAEAEVARLRKGLEKEVVSLISDATEAIIGEKVDAKKDAELIDKALKGRTA